jgi:hypothetical protein
MPAVDAGFGLREALFAPLARLRRRARLYLALDGALEICLALITAGAAQLLLDRWLRFSIDQRALLNSVITLSWLWVVYRSAVRPLARPLPDDRLAAWIDRAHPELHDHLSTAVQLGTGPPAPAGATAEHVSPLLVRSVLEDAAAAAKRVPFLAVLDHRRARRSAVELAVMIALIAAAFVALPETMQTWFRRNWLLEDIAWRQDTRILPIGFDAARTRRLPRGEDLELRAEVDGVVPSTATLTWWTGSGRRGRETMALEGGKRFLAALGPLTEDLTFRIVGGDERTADYTVQAVEPPRVLHTRATITLPAYTGLPPSVVQQQTVLELLNGSTLELEAELNKPVESAQLVGGGRSLSCVVLDDSSEGGAPRALLRWPAPASGTYRLELVDRDGWKDRNPVRFTLKVVPDAAPTVRMDAIGVGSLVTPQAELMLRLEFEDPYGLGAASMKIRTNEEAPTEQSFGDFQPELRRLEVRRSLPLAALPARAGDRLRIWAEAADLDPLGPNAAATPPLDVQVVSTDDFLADLARRELELRREFEHLVSAQRTLLDAFHRVQGDLSGDRAPSAAVQRVASLARQQTGHASRVLGFAQRFEQILAEMRTNRVARAADERRIADQLVEPLLVLGRRTMPDAAAALVAVRESPDAERVAAAGRLQDGTLLAMNAILANMLEREGYREAVDLLREIISEQSEVKADTLKAIEQQLQDILEPETRSEQTPPAEKP